MRGILRIGSRMNAQTSIINWAKIDVHQGSEFAYRTFRTDVLQVRAVLVLQQKNGA